MFATIVNALTIIVGTLVGLVLRKGLSERAKDVVFNSTGVISLIIGLSMALGGKHILALAISLIVGGLVGTALDIEGAIFKLGEYLRTRFSRKPKVTNSAETATSVSSGSTSPRQDSSLAESQVSENFAYGFLNASVLFCVGAMTLVGCFKAGAEGDYTLILTKAFMDGFIAVMFAGAMGAGVGLSALSVLVYQGALTLLAGWVAPYVSQELLTELSAVGGALVVMIGINLLGLKKIRTGDFLPSLILIVGLVALFPLIPIL